MRDVAYAVFFVLQVLPPLVVARQRARRWRCWRFALPFELVRPLGRLGPLQLTSAELVLYIALALSAAAIAIDVSCPTGAAALAAHRHPPRRRHRYSHGAAAVRAAARRSRAPTR